MTDIQVESTGELPVEAPRETPEPVTAEETHEEPETAHDAEAVEDHDGDDAGEEGEQPPSEPGKEKTPHGVQKKLDKLTARWKGEERLRKEAIARAEALEQRLSKLEAKPQGEPQLADFDYDPQAYLAARAKWEVHNTLEAERNQKVEAQKAQTAKHRQEQFQERIESFEDDHPDFKEVAFSPNVPITPAMGNAIADSDNGPAVAYYLGQHLDEARKLADMSDYQAVLGIAKLELQLVPTSQPRKLTTAPPPIKPLDPKAPIRKRLEDRSVGELIARNRQRRAKGLR